MTLNRKQRRAKKAPPAPKPPLVPPGFLEALRHETPILVAAMRAAREAHA